MIVLATLLREHFIRQKNPIFVIPGEGGGEEREIGGKRGWGGERRITNEYLRRNRYTNLPIIVIISCVSTTQ